MTLFIASCGSKLTTKEGTIELASYNNWPDSLVLETYAGGGMAWEWNKVYLSKDSSFYINSKQGTDNRYDFTLTQQELDQVLKEAIQNNIERLGVKKTDDVIYDKGTTSLTISLGKKRATIADGATEAISELHEGDFLKVYNLLRSIANAKTEKNRRTCCFRFDRSLKVPSKYLSVISMTADTSYGDSTNALKGEACFRLLQGIQKFQIHLTQRGRVNYMEYFASIYPSFNLRGDTTFILRIVRDSVLVLE